MEFVAIDASYLLAPGRRSPRTARPAFRRYVAREEGASPPDPSEAPDTAYWTAYDYYMAERDARTRRRAEAYALVAGFALRLRQRVLGG